MVDIHLTLQIGLVGARAPLSVLRVDPMLVDSVGTYAGSNHVLRMGSHFSAYLTTRPPALPTNTWVPPNDPYTFLASKLRAGGVTGNIGEMLTALVATRELNLTAADIGHIGPRKGRFKAPDYMLRLGNALPASISGKLPSNLRQLAVPQLWPAEAKAREYVSGSRQAAREALQQLLVYWWQIRNSDADAVGYGMINVLTYLANPPGLTLHLMLPEDRGTLVTELNRYNYRKLLAAVRTFDDPRYQEIRRNLYGC